MQGGGSESIAVIVVLLGHCIAPVPASCSLHVIPHSKQAQRLALATRSISSFFLMA